MRDGFCCFVPKEKRFSCRVGREEEREEEREERRGEEREGQLNVGFRVSV